MQPSRRAGVAAQMSLPLQAGPAATARETAPSQPWAPPPRANRRPPRWGGLLREGCPPPRLARDAFFVAAARRDAHAVRPILQEGRAAGHAFRIDWDGREPGWSQPDALTAVIQAARGLIVFCSPAAYDADHVRREVETAARFAKPILAVILAEGRRPQSVWEALASHRAIDVRADPSWRRHFLEALDGLWQGRSRVN